jgi:hypothetical protein
MVNTYALVDDLTDYLEHSVYTMPDEDSAARMLKRASEVIADATFQRSELVWFEVDDDHPADIYTDALRDAVLAQVEFWLEVGEEFDVTNAQGSLAISRVQMSRLPPKLSLRAQRVLRRVGLISGLVSIAR